MATAKTRNRIAGLALALLLAAVETGAVVHELEHQLKSPDRPCAQCVFASHIAKTPLPTALFAANVVPDFFRLAAPAPIWRQADAAGYAARAPPLSSEA
jgi:disulfide bond formation protein DsbB